MANYTDEKLLTDGNENPIPQTYNPTDDKFYPDTGADTQNLFEGITIGKDESKTEKARIKSPFIMLNIRCENESDIEVKTNYRDNSDDKYILKGQVVYGGKTSAGGILRISLNDVKSSVIEVEIKNNSDDDIEILMVSITGFSSPNNSSEGFNYSFKEDSTHIDEDYDKTVFYGTKASAGSKKNIGINVTGFPRKTIKVTNNYDKKITVSIHAMADHLESSSKGFNRLFTAVKKNLDPEEEEVFTEIEYPALGAAFNGLVVAVSLLNGKPDEGSIDLAIIGGKN